MVAETIIWYTADLGNGGEFWAPYNPNSDPLPVYAYVGTGVPGGPIARVELTGEANVPPFSYNAPLYQMFTLGSQPFLFNGYRRTTALPAVAKIPVPWPGYEPGDTLRFGTGGGIPDGKVNKALWEVLDGSFQVMGAAGLVGHGTDTSSGAVQIGAIVTGAPFEGAPGKLGWIDDEDFKWYYSDIPPYYNGVGYITSNFPAHDKGIVERVGFAAFGRKCLMGAGRAVSDVQNLTQRVSASWFTTAGSPLYPFVNYTYSATLPSPYMGATEANCMIFRYASEDNYISVCAMKGFYEVNQRYDGVDHFTSVPFVQDSAQFGLTTPFRLLPTLGGDGYQRGVGNAEFGYVMGNWLILGNPPSAGLYIPIRGEKFSGTKCGFSVGPLSMGAGNGSDSATPPQHAPPTGLTVNCVIQVEGWDYAPAGGGPPSSGGAGTVLGVAPPLRLKQRDDTYGLTGNARSPLRNAPHSLQGSPSPRVGGKNQYL